MSKVHFLLIAAVDVNVQTCTKLQTWPKDLKVQSPSMKVDFISQSLFILYLSN